MAKKSKKAAYDDDWTNDIGEDPVQETGEEFGETSSATAAATEAGPDDFLANIQRAKTKKDKKEKEPPAPQAPTGGPVIKSKKEKEREKKEKEKERKKALAARKKASNPTPEPEQQQQKEEEEAAPAPTPAKTVKKKVAKMPAGIAALRKQLELQKQMEEEQARLEEEERLAEEEAEKAAEREAAEKEAAKLAKKEKERLKKEQLKKEGKYLTKKQKAERALQERRKAALLQSGVQVAGLQQKAADGEPVEKKKIVYSSKKKSKKLQESNNAQAKKTTSSGSGAAGEDDDDEALVDDWENMALDDDEEEQEAAADAEAEGESWDAQESKEESVPVKKDVAPAAAPAAAPVTIAAPALPKTTAISKDGKELRSPICCILGHVDTGKTKLLDKIRQTNVQGGEAGGITQQIGATYFPIDALEKKTKVMESYEKLSYDVPGLLMIDTPGHESFTNLRTRGSSLCNIAILVIDIMHGLEQQTIESIRLLRDRKAPFIVALNKIDRLYGWETIPNNSFRDSFAKQKPSVQQEFDTRFTQVQVALAEQGLNSELYFKNSNLAKYVSIVPTSAFTGEGVPDLLWLLLELTQKRMSKQLRYLSGVEATILEVKVIEGLGTTIDVVLSNGILKEGDRIVLCGLNGPIATNIRALLTPPPARELRIKSEYMHHKEVKAAIGVKITANDLEKAVAGSRLLVVGPDDDEDQMMDDVMEDLTDLLDNIDPTGRGVVVQASTLGSLEALLDFLKDMKIPVMSIGLGPVYKRDVMKAVPMLDKAKELAVMLCFDVKIDKEAEQYANENNIKIFNAEIIYHLFDAFTAYQEKLLEEKRKTNAADAIFPCVLKTLQIINKRNPMIIGVDVIEGCVKVGTPICAVKPDGTGKNMIPMVLGTVQSLEVNHESKSSVRKGDTNAGVAMRLDPPSGQQPTWGRHVDEKDQLFSLISRKSIDTLKDPAFRSTVPREDWLLIKKLKKTLDIE